MMKVLYILQQSILDNKRDWMSADSNINMASGFFRSWINHDNMAGFEVDVLIAPLCSFSDIEDYSEVFPEHQNLSFKQYPMTRNAALNRMDFRSTFFRDLIRGNRYDIIITCIPEWVLAIKTVYDVEKEPMPIIISQCFWLDTPNIGEPKQPEHITLQYRQMEGFALSDLVVFTCESTKKAWIQNAIKLMAPMQLLNIMNKSTIWDFGYSDREVNELTRVSRFEERGPRVRIGFLNRMGSDGYTNAATFIEALKLLSQNPEYAHTFEVVFTNPSKRVTEEWLQENVPNFVSVNGGEPLSRSEYFKFLYDCDVTVHLFVKERYGGCALRESIAAMNFTVVTDCHEQSTLIKDKNLRVGPVEPLTAESVAASLRYAISVVRDDMGKFDQLTLDKAYDLRQATMEENYNRCSFESQIQKVLADVAKLISASA